MKKYSKLAVAALVCVFATNLAIAGDAKKSEISADAVWIAHLDVAALTQCKLWQQVSMDKWPEKDQKKYAAFSAMIGMDPLKDITGVTVSGESFGEERGAAVVHGVFPVSHLTTLIEASEKHETKSYAGATLHRWLDKKKGGESAACLYNAQTLVLGKDFVDIEGAIDVLAGRKPNLAKGGKLTVPKRPVGTIAWLHGADPKGQMNAGADNAILKNARELTLRVGEQNDTVTLAATILADNEEDAAIIEMAVRGLVAFAVLAGEENPELAKLASQLNCATDGNTVSLSLNISVDEVVKAIEEGQARKAAADKAPVAQ